MTWEWVDESKSFAVGCGIMIVHSAEWIHSLVNERCLSINEDFPLESIDGKKWLSFYWNRRRAHRDYLDAFEKSNPGMDAVEIHPGLSIFSKSTNRAFKPSLVRQSQKMFTMLLRGDYNPPGELALGLRFFIQIMIPCWIMHEEVHGVLYRRARRGDLKAFVKLLKLDKMIIGDRLLSRSIAATLALRSGSAQSTTILGAMGNRAEPIKIRKVKELLAALIYMNGKYVGQRLTYSKVHKIFDDYAHDQGVGLYDEDLPVGVNFERAVRRHLKFWSCFEQK